MESWTYCIYIYDSRVAREIINTPHSKFGVPDKILWSRSKKGKYKVDEGYKLITMEQDGIANHGMNGMDRKNLWKLKIPYKICMFLWKLLHNGLSTRMELIRRQIMVSPKCVMCDQEDERWIIFFSNVFLIELYGLSHLIPFDLMQFHLFNNGW